MANYNPATDNIEILTSLTGVSFLAIDSTAAADEQYKRYSGDSTQAAILGSVTPKEIYFTSSDTFPKTIFATTKNNTLVQFSEVSVIDPFNGTNTTLSLGDSADNNRLIPSSSITATSKGVYKIHPLYVYSPANSSINLYLSGTGISQGSGIVSLKIYELPITGVQLNGTVAGLLPSVSGIAKNAPISGSVTGLLPSVDGSIASSSPFFSGNITGLLPSVAGTVSAPLHADTTDWVTRVVAAGGTVSTARQNAVNSLVTSAYSNGLRDSVSSNHIIQYAIPFAVDPSSPVAAIFEPLWKPSGVTGSASGLISGAYSLTGYAFSGSNYWVTGYLPSTYMTSSSAHMAVDMRNTTRTSTLELIGSGSATSYLDLYWADTGLGADGFSPDVTTYATSSSITGLNLYNRNSSTSLRISNGGSLKTSSTTNNTVAPPDVAVTIGAYYDTSDGGAPVAVSHSNETVGFFSLGLGMSTSLETTLNTAVSTLRTAIAAS